MTRSRPFLITALVSLVAAIPFQSNANAQGRGGNPRLFGTIPAVTLAQLDVVQEAAKLTDEQKNAAKELQEKLNEDRMTLFQDAQGDWDKIGSGMTKLYAESFEALNAKLDAAQVKRMRELYIQANQAMVLADEPIQKMLEITAEQKSKLEDAIQQSREKMFSAFQDFQNMSAEERTKTGNEMVESRDKSLLAVLNEAQQKAYEEAYGEKIEIDLSKLPMPGGR